MYRFFFPTKKKKKWHSLSSCPWPCYFLSLDESFTGWSFPPGWYHHLWLLEGPSYCYICQSKPGFFLNKKLQKLNPNIFSHWKHIHCQYPTTSTTLEPSAEAPSSLNSSYLFQSRNQMCGMIKKPSWWVKTPSHMDSEGGAEEEDEGSI